MSRLLRWEAGLLALVLLAGSGGAPATPSYLGVEQAAKRLREAVQARPQPNSPGWETYCTTLEQELRNFSGAPDDDARLRSLGKLYQMWTGLRGFGWAPAVDLRTQLQTWLQPRIALAWASRRMVESVRGLPPTNDPNARTWRDGWVDFVDDRLGVALREYEGATNATRRVEALGKIDNALKALGTSNRSRPWQQSLVLYRALNDLYGLPNLDATIDASTLSAYLGREVVEPGPVLFKGQVSYVTPGPRTGFGLLSSDQGIAFYNSQYLTSVTPIRGFQDQIAQDQRGQRAAKLYQFNATSQNNAHLTVNAVLGNGGLSVAPAYQHNVNASISTDPIPGFGKGLTRAFAGLIGFNQERITQEVYNNAIGQIQEQVVSGAAELGQIKAVEGAARENVRIRNSLPGDGTLRAGPVLVDGLSLRSRPSHALIGGNLQWLGAKGQRGADFPQPPHLAATVPSGVAADIHLGSVLSNLLAGYLQAPNVQGIRNVMILTHKVPPGATPQQALQMVDNVDYPDFAKAVETARAANDPQELAVRVKRPERAPEFTADANGYLVAVVHDFMIEVPAPAQQQGGIGALLGNNGPPALVYRVSADSAEVALSFKIEPPPGGGPLKFNGRIESVDFGPNAKVEQVTADESEAREVGPLVRAGALAIFANRLKGQAIDLPLSNFRIPAGFVVRTVSPLDPSGWIRLVLSRG